ncbi:hypothetical protein PR003_g19709 [Phytophthora rubi]|uniref:RxLR effector protein n=1 Tax=Phytophthora rubi TaxID=129364 RepID=A0A6A3JZU3_9STRA|nr:hypothetical protein PR002_g19072 [Phytophthora rubi]KAE9001023.1 hypothetical protein PR001_g18635 [Phytophthora rubi]KAE9312660.1 hypothetical protein PR003_g19709 [Phytophthora rubi]
MIPKFHSTAVHTPLICLLNIVPCIASANRGKTKSLTEYTGSSKFALPSKTSVFS